MCDLRSATKSSITQSKWKTVEDEEEEEDAAAVVEWVAEVAAVVRWVGGRRVVGVAVLLCCWLKKWTVLGSSMASISPAAGISPFSSSSLVAAGEGEEEEGEGGEEDGWWSSERDELEWRDSEGEDGDSVSVSAS